MFEFIYIERDDEHCEVIEGRLLLEKRRQDQSVIFDLVPMTESDAKECERLRSSRLWPVPQWAEERL
jgi:hypothetical protein